jgi:hypothetical protein
MALLSGVGNFALFYLFGKKSAMNTRYLLEMRAFANDPRNCDRAAAPTVFIDQPDGTQLEVTLPLKWDVCPVCEGRGTHVNPAIDCQGLTAEDFDEDPDFADEYMSGTYDQQCNRCGGRTTVPVVDEDRCTKEQLAAWEEQERDNAACEAEHRAEIAFGC